MNRLAVFRRLAVTALALTCAPVLVACNKHAEAKVEEAAAPVQVQTATVVEVAAPKVLRLTGSLKGWQETDLAANANGRVTATKVERGVEVQKGTVIAQLDTRAAALSLAEAQANVANSRTQEEINKADCARYEQLKAKGAVTDLEYDQVTAKCKTAPINLQAAAARASLAAQNVGDGTIRAPFSGVISERYVEVGEYVQTASKVVSIAQVDQLRLEFSVPEANLPSVKQDAEVAFRVAAYGDTLFHGKVRYVSGAVRAATRDLVVEALVPNADKKLLPGMFADVELAIGTQNLPAVPKEAVFEQNGKKNVFVVKNGSLEQRVLQPSTEFEGKIPVLKGASVGDVVVTAELDKLTNGQRVN